ncbi:hypothetical protein D1013_17655 [Euzebyella marina]|uniref:MBL fold metallo-hydrolase n=1 Tax=Euzebyella marina TaxID=1761453 RepID=A0A3G2LA37_9FLAO|nr:hypothetical protein [Euzebyella marina]AYN69073.1 hypothetical protein D1013_17655 [Euzebyella marina]
MYKITFKNVGQGDSIIIEWLEGSHWKVGVVDCNKYYGNPVLEHIINEGYNELEFVILSHPHDDHFSGILELLEKCRDNNISIKTFLHTCKLTREFLDSCSKSVTSRKKLVKIFEFLLKYSGSLGVQTGTIEAGIFENVIKLNSNSYLEFFSPFHVDYVNFAASRKYDVAFEKSGNNNEANKLSTIINIQLAEGHILLTSDAPKYNLTRVDDKFKGKISGSLFVGQSAHHGSPKNHSKIFWNKRAKNDQSKIVFSVGENGHKHPDENVVKYFIDKGYIVHSTNTVGPFSSMNGKGKKSSLLDSFSTLVPQKVNNNLQGDQVFEFTS